MSRAASDLDAEIDALYESAPDAFTKKRDELAKRLKAEGNADASATVKALRKPTQIAYVLNQVARRFADEVGELVDVGRELARAQRKALRGGDASGELRAAIGRQRDVVRDLTTKTGTLMRELDVGATGHLDEIAGALQAALVDPIVGAQLEEGRLEKVPAPAAGFPGAAPQLVVVEEPKTRAKPKHVEAPKKTATEKKADKKAEALAAKRAAAERARHEKAEKARAKLEAARERHDAKAAALDAKKRTARERVLAAAEKAKTRADELGANAAEVRRTADELRADAERLTAEAKELAKHARERAKEAAASRKAADDAETKAKKSEKEADVAEREASRLATKARAG